MIAPRIEGALRIAAVGSRITCNPAPTNTDQDWLVLFRSLRIARRELIRAGYSASSAGYRDTDFLSFRRGEVNVIAIHDTGMFDRFMAGTAVAKRLNLLDKADRIALFQAVLYGNPCT